MKNVLICIFLLHFDLIFSDELRFRYITVDDGLPVNDVNIIRQDENGFIWIGTQDGLCRWDGINLITFKAGYRNRYLSNSRILSLYTEKNFLYVGTNQGLNEINLSKDSIKIFYPEHKDLSSKWNTIREIVRYRNFLLCATPEGIVMFEMMNRILIKKKWEDMPENGVNNILKLSDNTILLSSSEGLWEWNIIEDKIKKINLSYIGNINENVTNFTTMLFYGGFLYVGTTTKGILKIDLDTKEILGQISFASINENKKENYITGLSVYNNSILATSKRGVYIINPINNNYTSYYSDNKKYSLLSDEINSFYIDKNGNLWFATENGGVNYFLRNFKKFQTNEKYNVNLLSVLGIYEIEKDKIICSSNSDLVLINLKSGQVYNLTKYFKVKSEFNVIKENMINSDEIFLCSTGNGIYVLDKNKLNKISKLHATEGYTVVSLIQHKNYLFLGTVENGLIIYDLNNNTFRVFDKKDNLSNTIYDIKIHTNRIYFATNGDGLIVLDLNELLKGKIKILKQFNPLTTDSFIKIASGVINCVLIDRYGNIHCGSDNGIIVIKDNKNPLLFNDENGLLNNFVCTLTADSSGNIWYSTNKGIGFYNPENLSESNFRNYTLEDGIKNNEHNIGSSHFSKSGMMYFGGPDGITFFRPSEFKAFKKTPDVILVNLTNNGQKIITDTTYPYKKKIYLDWKKNNFTAEFVALDFNNPLKNKFAYKLQGYDDKWSIPQYNRFITYTELPGGTYTLLVKALSSEGIWSSNPYKLIVVVIPPFWKTKWFMILLIIIITSGFYGYTFFKTRKIEKEKKILEIKVQERTKELAQKNRDLTSSIEYAKRIQTALLPEDSYLKKEFKNIFIFYLPKDIVSGDFYWAGIKNGLKIIAAVDCTGHGVPGAFMSLIGCNLLNQIILEKGITCPDEILNRLNIEILNVLKQSGKNSETNDGMDVSILCWNEKNEFFWSGANRPLVFIENGKLQKFNGNKYPIGGSQFDLERKFTLYKFLPKENGMFYLFSDGYPDQFGGEKGKKYMMSRLTNLLQEIYYLELDNQLKLISNRFFEWKRNLDQVDDVLLIGVKT